MPFAFTLPVFVLLGAVVVASLLIFVSRRYRYIPGSGWFTVMMVCVGLWSAAYGFQIASLTRDGKIFWQTVKYVGIVLAPVVWFAFAIEYAGHGDRLTSRRLALILVEPAVSFLLAATNASQLFWTRRTFVGGPTPHLDVVHGPAFIVHTSYSYLLLVAGSVALVWTFLRSQNLYRGQIAMLLAAVGVPWAANALYLLGLNPLGAVDPTPVSFILMGVLFGVAVEYLRLLDLMPVVQELARDAAIEDMATGAAILDVRGRVVDCNGAAERLLGHSRSTLLGQSAADVLPAPDGTLDWDEDLTTEATTTVDGEYRYLELQTTTLSSLGGLTIGHLVTLHDVTDRTVREQRLEVQNRVLRHNLRNDMNLILGHLDLLSEQVSERELKDEIAYITSKAEHLVDQSEKTRAIERILNRDTSVRDIDLASEVRSVVRNCRTRYPSTTFEMTLPPRLWVAVDESLGDAVEELVENAVSHSEGASTVEIEARRRAERVELSVVDDGPGIPDHERDVITSGRETALEHSSGLGLWLVKWVVMRSGGDIAIRDNEPRGSVVTLSLPAATRQNTAETPRNSA